MHNSEYMPKSAASSGPWHFGIQISQSSGHLLVPCAFSSSMINCFDNVAAMYVPATPSLPSPVARLLSRVCPWMWWNIPRGKCNPCHRSVHVTFVAWHWRMSPNWCMILAAMPKTWLGQGSLPPWWKAAATACRRFSAEPLVLWLFFRQLWFIPLRFAV